MVTPKRHANGSYSARKRLPDDVRDEYARLYGPRLEAKLTLPASTKPNEAKQRFAEWLGEVEGRIAAIRAVATGIGVSLTVRQARALAGEWYHWFVERHPTTDVRHWSELRARVHDALTDYVRSEDDVEDPDALYRENPKVREGLRPLLSDAGETSQFLALKRLTLMKEAHALFVDNLYDDLDAAAMRMGSGMK